MIGRHAGRPVVLAGASLAGCLALGALLGRDPLLGLEIAGVALVALWAALVAQDLVRARRLAAALSADAVEASLFGISCWVSPALGLDAIVIGAVRPRIFIGDALLTALAEDELRAVVYHEDHHRRTRAPIRAAALQAWLRLLGHSAWARGPILDRLADLEVLADADAIRRGSSARSLVRALLKDDASPRAVAFAHAADRRIRRLLNTAAGGPADPPVRQPYEWLLGVLLAVAVIGCHVGF
ncbi:MAG TPA: hypothetical protein VNO86_03245 [Candidatus Binatia bacterium]|nr:hypothetical protein [Candidatus Binatia bacterium]